MSRGHVANPQRVRPGIVNRGPSNPNPPPVPTGTSGSASGIGPPGTDGADGNDGEPGAPGQAGAAGVSGPQGAQGPPGFADDGNDGEMGAPGERGSVGPQGDAGPFGPPGFPGFDGDEGPEGRDGVPGARGEVGPTGATGASGAAGTAGAAGVPGPDGADGVDGEMIVIQVPAAGLAFIEEQSPTGTAITFSNLGAYRHLKIIGNVRGDTAATAIAINLSFNGDTGTNYDRQIVQGVGATASATENLGINPNQGIMVVPAASATAGLSGYGEITIPDYRGTTFQKCAFSTTFNKTGTSTGLMTARVVAYAWRSTAAITSITLTCSAGNFAAGTKFTLYGM